jgi:hypothetical protein
VLLHGGQVYAVRAVELPAGVVATALFHCSEPGLHVHSTATATEL